MSQTKDRRVQIRMPKDLYEVVAREAVKQHRSVSNYIIMVLSEWTGSNEP